jgi:hypothetical protein
MVTLAEILQMRSETNLCKIRIPLFEAAGNKSKVEMWATMMLPPGIHSGYEVGDVVFVTFTDNNLGRPTVLGLLYRGAASGTNAIDSLGYKDKSLLNKATKFSCGDLTADGAVKLPFATTFESQNQAIGKKTFGELYDYTKSLQQEITKLRSDTEAYIQSLQQEITKLKSDIEVLKASGGDPRLTIMIPAMLEDKSGFNTWEKAREDTLAALKTAGYIQ